MECIYIYICRILPRGLMFIYIANLRTTADLMFMFAIFVDQLHVYVAYKWYLTHAYSPNNIDNVNQPQ